jgi:hypothetical protein
MLSPMHCVENCCFYLQFDFIRHKGKVGKRTLGWGELEGGKKEKKNVNITNVWNRRILGLFFIIS